MTKNKKHSLRNKSPNKTNQKSTSLWLLKLKVILNWTWKALIAIGVLITVSSAFFHYPIDLHNKTPHEQFLENNYTNGILLSGNVSDQIPLKIISGGNTQIYSKELLIEGIKYNPSMVSANGDEMTVEFKLINDRIYVYSEFRDYLNDEIIGYIDSNSYHLKNGQSSNFKSDDHRLEVYDKHGYVVFSLDGRIANEIKICGYFDGKIDLLVLTNHGTSPVLKKSNNYKETAEQYISTIERIFP